MDPASWCALPPLLDSVKGLVLVLECRPLDATYMPAFSPQQPPVSAMRMLCECSKIVPRPWM
jgi:hypothetical protein